MARVAVVDGATNIVLALIIAEASDPPYQGTFLVDADHTACDVGWTYDPVVNDFIDPNPPAESENDGDDPPPFDEDESG